MFEYNANTSPAQKLPMNTVDSKVTKSELMDIKELNSCSEIVKYIRQFKQIYNIDSIFNDEYVCGKEIHFDLKEHTLNILLNYTRHELYNPDIDINQMKTKQFIYQIVESDIYMLFKYDLDYYTCKMNKNHYLTQEQYEYVFHMLWLFTNIFGYDFNGNFDILKLNPYENDINSLFKNIVVFLKCTHNDTIVQAGWCLTNIIGDIEMAKLINIANIKVQLLQNVLYALNKTTYALGDYENVLWFTSNLFKNYECLIDNDITYLILSQIKTFIDNVDVDVDVSTYKYILNNYTWLLKYLYKNITEKRYRQLCSIGLTIEYMLKFAFNNKKHFKPMLEAISDFSYELSMPNEIITALKSVNFSIDNPDHMKFISKKNLWLSFMNIISNIACDSNLNDAYIVTIVDKLMNYSISNCRMNTSFVALFGTLCAEYVNGNLQDDLRFNHNNLIKLLFVITQEMFDEKPFIEGDDFNDMNNTYTIELICNAVKCLVSDSSDLFTLEHVEKLIIIFNRWMNRCQTDTSVLETCIINLENYKDDIMFEQDSETESEDSEVSDSETDSETESEDSEVSDSETDSETESEDSEVSDSETDSETESEDSEVSNSDNARYFLTKKGLNMLNKLRSNTDLFGFINEVVNYDELNEETQQLAIEYMILSSLSKFGAVSEEIVEDSVNSETEIDEPKIYPESEDDINIEHNNRTVLTYYYKVDVYDYYVPQTDMFKKTTYTFETWNELKETLVNLGYEQLNAEENVKFLGINYNMYNVSSYCDIKQIAENKETDERIDTNVCYEVIIYENVYSELTCIGKYTYGTWEDMKEALVNRGYTKFENYDEDIKYMGTHIRRADLFDRGYCTIQKNNENHSSNIHYSGKDGNCLEKQETERVSLEIEDNEVDNLLEILIIQLQNTCRKLKKILKNNLKHHLK